MHPIPTTSKPPQVTEVRSTLPSAKPPFKRTSRSDNSSAKKKKQPEPDLTREVIEDEEIDPPISEEAVKEELLGEEDIDNFTIKGVSEPEGDLDKLKSSQDPGLIQFEDLDPSLVPNAGSVSASDRDVLLFVTNPEIIVRLNPSLFPSGVGWSAKSLLPSDGQCKSKKSDAISEQPPPLPDPLPKIPADCRETLLEVNFTPEEYLEQTVTEDYYAQGIKLVDGVRRVVFYHRLNM